MAIPITLRVGLHYVVLLLCLIPLLLNFHAIFNLFQPKPLSGRDPALETHPLLINNYTTTDFPPVSWHWNTPADSYFPTHRSEVYHHFARVACWPRSGGVWLKRADLVDLNYLGLDRQWNTPRQFDQVAEDEFCAKLRAVGAEWWPLTPEPEENLHKPSGEYRCEWLEECYPPTIPFKYLIAWPEAEQAACFVRSSHAEGKGTIAWNVYHNSMNMDERCNGILMLGGKWCGCKEGCPEIGMLDWGRNDRGRVCGSLRNRNRNRWGDWCAKGASIVIMRIADALDL